MISHEAEFVPAVYIGRENSMGVSLNVGERFLLKEERGIPREERIREASRRMRKKDAKIEFSSTWKILSPDTDNSMINEAFRASAEGLPHFKDLNMGMLAASWLVYLRLNKKTKDVIITPKDIRWWTITKSRRSVIDSNFTIELRTILLSLKKETTAKSSDLPRESIEWDLIRYVTILIKFKPTIKSVMAKQ